MLLIIVGRQFPGIFFKEEGFFELSENKFPLKLTHYTLRELNVQRIIIPQKGLKIHKMGKACCQNMYLWHFNGFFHFAVKPLHQRLRLNFQ